MRSHLVLRLHAPLIAFGGEAIDNLGVIRDFPALSMVTGLIANALGWDRSQGAEHNRLQERLRIGCVLEPGTTRLQDYQTAILYQKDAAWTTWGEKDVREPSPSYQVDSSGRQTLTQQRYRDYHTNLCAWVALALQPAEEMPTLQEIATALDQPARPLFIGRKPCLPTGRLVAGWQVAADIHSALQALVAAHGTSAHQAPWHAQWPDGEGSQPGDRLLDICDERNWISGVHGGWRPVREAALQPLTTTS